MASTWATALATGLMCGSAGITAVLGGMHVLYTLHGRRLWPRHSALQAQMAQDTLVLTAHTTVWRAWIGFNLSHSLGLLLYAAVYAYLAWVHPVLLFQSVFLMGVGAVLLVGYGVLAWRYWFRAPLLGVVGATLCLLAAGVVARFG